MIENCHISSSKIPVLLQSATHVSWKNSTWFVHYCSSVYVICKRDKNKIKKQSVSGSHLDDSITLNFFSKMLTIKLIVDAIYS